MSNTEINLNAYFFQICVMNVNNVSLHKLFFLPADGHHIWEMEAKVNRETSKSVSFFLMINFIIL